MSLCDRSSSGRWTGGGDWWAWGGPCQPHTVQQLSRGGREKLTEVGGKSGGQTKGDQKLAEELEEKPQNKRERQSGVLCPSGGEPRPPSHFQQEAPFPS